LINTHHSQKAFARLISPLACAPATTFSGFYAALPRVGDAASALPKGSAQLMQSCADMGEDTPQRHALTHVVPVHNEAVWFVLLSWPGK